MLYLLYTFLLLSRTTEVLVPIPKLMLVLGCLSFLVSFVTGRANGLYARLSLLMSAWIAIGVLSVPFSMWPTGSIKQLIGWVPNLVVFYAGTQLVTSPQAVRRVLHVMAASSVILLAYTLLRGESSVDQRLLLSGSGLVSDPNDLAAALLFMLPSWLIIFFRSRGLGKLVVGAVAVAILLAVLKTGSRGGLLTLFVLLLFALKPLPLQRKVIAVILLAVLAMMGFALLPSSTRLRYATILAPSEMDSGAADVVVGAEMSRDIRFEIFKAGVRTTFRHPLGVGIGQIDLGINEDFEKHGRRATWRSPHNTYTQVSGDLGFPGLFVYLAILITCFRTTGKVLRMTKDQPRLQEVNRIANCARLSLVSFCISSAFLTHAYLFFVPTLGALCYGLKFWIDTVDKRSGLMPA
ncbi:MAG: O-antigen ligase family protein [Acidobacteria bacterium]|nr:O-antigen ligase family protein [Acidobacteriota bacterium]